MGNLPLSWGYPRETGVNTGCDELPHGSEFKGGSQDLSLRDELTSYQLVGEVTAHQGLRVADLRGRSATLGLRHCPDSYGRLQSRILDNARKRDPATPRGG